LDAALDVAASVVVGLVALVHVYFLVLEMFLWRTPRVRAIFGTTEEVAESSAVLAANQGLYNGFLAAGLVFGLVAGGPDASVGFPVTVFFLACVIVAGLYGAATANRRILLVQALPGAVALGLVLVAHS
jgi:putative membrane protein